MQSQNVKWAAAVAAMGVMIGMTACNKKSEESASREIQEESKDAVQDIKQDAQAATDKVKEEATQTTRDIKEGADKAVSKVKEESRQATRDTKEGAQSAADKTKEAMTKASPGDAGVTKTDEQVIARVRGELSKHNDVSGEAKYIAIKAENGKVKLTGTVTSKEISKEIARIAGKETGVKSVDNELKVAERVGAGTAD